ncbi:diguanylate cyclase (GGDEF)-like protein [Cryobacterium sp. CAN_C3]|uniref:putative bifunctional diguanylate cyclase/phosphodiesterase n=1 Tax=unclassified Cryobacterium TaxID=2649013 RepID=UPI0018C8E4A7|nr:EAL domain-containing protein [Cryobacterium sp. CAN_C3]MEC5153403.1 diguanylate cyclase (GGDEF)-like protein [Cryobacterium sp. CAN_C3]
MGLPLGGYLLGLALHKGEFNPIVDGWFGTLTQLIPAAVCWMAVYRTRFRHIHVLLAALAMTSYALGNTYYVLTLAGSLALPFPSPADIGYLGFYPLMLGTLFVLGRFQVWDRSWSMVLEGAVGSLGAAAVLAVLLGPVLALDSTGPPSLATAVAVAYPLFDLLLVAAIFGIAASQSLMVGRFGAVLAIGLVIFAAADVIYAQRVTSGLYAIGTPLDAGWSIGLTLVAVWIDRSVRADTAVKPAGLRVTAFAVSGVSTVAGLGVLVLGTQVRVSMLALILAGLVLILAAIRAQLAFRQLVRMSDLHRQSRTDDLTGLPNRRALYSDVPGLLAAGQAGRSALLLLDLDRFKEVNDSLGHDIGDRLLAEVGRRLSQQLRTDDLLARIGGDEFAIFLDNTDQDQAVAVALKLRAALAEPVTLEGIALQTDVSIGIALAPDHGGDVGLLLRRADMAMYKAKFARSGHHVYARADDSRGEERLRTLEELRIALVTDQLILHYQPKIDLATGDVNAVEALVRWKHPGRGLLYPDTFLPLAEEAGLMHDLTNVVLGKALDQAAAWRAHNQPLTVAVNFSASSLINADLPARISAMLVDRGLPPTALTLEITEEFLMADFPRARVILSLLRGSGIQISVDDFGTGYSSLAYLRDLPIDELKLDKSFVMPMADDPRAAALVASTIVLAHSLGLRMVAEGVESEAVYNALARSGCDQAQGYYMSRPIPATELDRWLANHRTVAATGLAL